MAYYNKWIPLEQVRFDCGVSRDGSNAKNVLLAARNYGFEAKGYRFEPESLKEEGLSRGKAFLYGFISGVVEPIAAALAILVTVFVEAILPFVLAFAAGVMIYVVVEELIPEANEGSHSNLATIGLAVGFVLMMVLDIALG